MSEEELYPHVVKWLRQFLADRHRRSKIKVFDTSRRRLSRFLFEKGLDQFLPGSDAWDVQVDITGFIQSRKAMKLAFVECKLKRPSLKDLSQLLGYSIVAEPAYSFLLSPRPASDSLFRLLEIYEKLDLLEYGENKRIRILRWDIRRGEVDSTCVLPHGAYF
jgi:hypothetical protein